MTEKLFRPLHVGSVPVYKGSPRAKDYMPDNHSMILVDDFDSPKTLANFLHKLNGDDEEYEVSTINDLSCESDVYKYLQYSAGFRNIWSSRKLRRSRTPI